jgi:thiosulfate dehydrogenase [quinone] large subunit
MKLKISNLPSHDYTNKQLTALVLLRILIGWHFLYEGIVKLLNPYWSSAGFLLESKGIFSGIFTFIADSPTALTVVDFLNIWGLILIGCGLIAGLLSNIASIAGIIILLLYYLCNPPFIGYTYSSPSEGSYLIVNKNLIEMAALFLLKVFPSGHLIGLDSLIFKKRS